MIDIIVTTHSRRELLDKTLSSIIEKTKVPYRLFVYDDCSSDGTQEYLVNFDHEQLTQVILGKKRMGVRYGFDALWSAVREYDQFLEKYPFMCYFQDDMEVMEEGWIGILLKAYTDFKDKYNIGFVSGYDCIEHPNVKEVQWEGQIVRIKKSTGFPNVIAEKSFWESVGRVPRRNPNGREVGFPNDGKGSNLDVWFTGCYSQSRFDRGAASGTCAYRQGKNTLVIPMIRHLAQVSGSTWAEDRYKKKVLFVPGATKQHESEIMALCKHVGSLRNVIEIGTFKGGSTLVFASISSGKVITIDVKMRRDLCFKGTVHEGKIRKIEGESQADETEAKVWYALGKEKADLLFIDGGHSYEEVKEDFNRYSKYVAYGGWIAFHDIKNTDEGIGVPAFWDEVKREYESESKEFCIMDQPEIERKTIWGLEERKPNGDCNRNGIGLIRWRIPGQGKAVAFFSNGLGNFVMMMPALQAMASLTKDGKVDLCIDDKWRDNRRPAVEDICKSWPTIGKMIRYPKEGLNAKNYEHWFFSAHGGTNNVAPVFLFKMRQIVPKPQWRSSQVHEADHYMDIARGAGYVGEIPKVDFPMTQDPVIDLPRPIVGICNGYFRVSTHHWDKKGWPHFARLSELLDLYLGGSVVGLGLKDEIPPDVKVTVDYTGKLDILQTAKVISQLDLLVTTDTGLMHLGNIMGVPLIAMFGPTLTTKNAPTGDNSHVLQAGLKCVPCQDTSTFVMCKSNECMRSITPGEVMAKAREVLKRRC